MNQNYLKKKFTNSDLPRAQFTDTDLPRAQFTDTNLPRAQFTDTNLPRAQFTDTNLPRAQFPEANLQRAQFLDADLQHAQFSEANLQRTQFHGSNIHQADLTGADARDAEFTPGNSTPTNLEDTVLRRTDLRRANLSDTRLYQADLTDARINRKTTFDDTTVYERNPELSGWFRDTTDAYGAAAWVHRRLERLHESAAASEEARRYHIRKQEAERAGHKRRALQRPRELKRHAVQRLRSSKMYTIRRLRGFNTRAKQRLSTLWPDDVKQTEEEDDSDNAATTRDDSMTSVEDVSDSNDTDGEADDTDGADDSETSDDYGPNPPTTPLVSAYRYLSLSLMYHLSKHGESLQRIGWRATQIILVAGVLYPLAGGIASDSTNTTHEFPGGDVLAADSLSTTVSLAAGGLGEFLWGLYFSVITFTTIGYGDLYPVGTAAKVLVGVESLSGAVLVALFVFVLGRRVAR